MQNLILPPELETKLDTPLTISLNFAEAYNLFIACSRFVDDENNPVYQRFFLNSLVERIHQDIQSDHPEYFDFCEDIYNFLAKTTD
jgi:hypothetical protein